MQKLVQFVALSVGHASYLIILFTLASTIGRNRHGDLLSDFYIDAKLEFRRYDQRGLTSMDALAQ